MKVFVYFNLHKKCWSVKNRSTGRVIAHAQVVHLKDAKFKVSRAGRERVLREQRKNVHAGVAGDLISLDQPFTPTTSSRAISYNPYKAAHFFDVASGAPVSEAARAVLSERKVWVD